MHFAPRTLAAPYTRPIQVLKPRAVVDWVSIIVRLKRASNPGYLKRAFEHVGVSQVIPKDLGPGGAATVFEIRLQHPERYEVIRDLIDGLELTYGFVSAPQLEELEVAVDFWPLTDDMAEQEEMTKRLMMSIAPPVINNPRIADGGMTILLPKGTEIDPQMTLYVGDKDDELLWRVYWKRTDDTFVGDDGKREPKPIPEEQWRARAEVRLRGGKLRVMGLSVPSDLEAFKFERLHTQGYFKFCRRDADTPVRSLLPILQPAYDSLGINDKSPACVLATKAKRDSRHRPLKISRFLTTDTELTDAVRGALRSLTRRF